jgi:hypothetical protein
VTLICTVGYILPKIDLLEICAAQIDQKCLQSWEGCCCDLASALAATKKTIISMAGTSAWWGFAHARVLRK